MTIYAEASELIRLFTRDDLFSGLQIVRAYKSASTSRSNDASPSLDPDLQLSLLANVDYRIAGAIFYDSDPTPDFRQGWSIPSGATIKIAMKINRSGSAVDSNQFFTDSSESGSVAANTSTHYQFVDGMCLMGSTAGTLGWKWAQNTSSGIATTVQASSLLVAIPMSLI